jgi:hypothetical protein
MMRKRRKRRGEGKKVPYRTIPYHPIPSHAVPYRTALRTLFASASRREGPLVPRSRVNRHHLYFPVSLVLSLATWSISVHDTRTHTHTHTHTHTRQGGHENAEKFPSPSLTFSLSLSLSPSLTGLNSHVLRSLSIVASSIPSHPIISSTVS